MKLTLFFAYIEGLITNYSIIINRLILYNEYYNGKDKNIINRNLNTINYFIIFLQEIGLIIYERKPIDDFFKLMDMLNIDNYNLIDINDNIYYYHINSYKLYVEVFEHLKKIIKNIKLFCDEVKIIKEEINSKIREIQRNQNIIKSSSSIDFFRKTLETFIIKKSRSANKRDIINEIITRILNLEKRNKKKFLEVKNVLKEYNIYDDNNEDIKQILNRENKETLNKINENILSIYMKLSSSKKTEEIINEIIIKLINIKLNNLFEEIKNKLSFNYNIKSKSINEEDIILEIIKIIITETTINNRISEIKKIIKSNYYKKKDINENLLIEGLIEIKEINKNITGYIKNELNIKEIFILDKYLKNNYKLFIIDEIINILRGQDNMTLKKINKIISKINIDDDKNKDLINLEKYYKFVNSWNNINILDIDNVIYMINETNEIKRDIKSCNLLNIEIKEKILSKIIYYSYDIFDNINVKISSYFIPINNYKNDIIELSSINVNDIMKITELYHKLVSNNLTDVKINEIVNEILKINNHYLYKLLDKKFKLINLHYKFDYNNITISNHNNFKIYLEKIYLYKNYIIVIRNLYIYLLSIKNNFNLLYTTIQKIKKKIELYKKLDNSLNEMLFRKLNYVNDDNENGIKFENYEDINTYLDKFMFN